MKVRTVGPEARARLLKATTGRGYQDRAPYREAIASLSGNETLELELEDGETMRQMRVRLARAAKEVNIEIKSGDTREGSLLVWLPDPTRTKRTRRKRNADGELV